MQARTSGTEAYRCESKSLAMEPLNSSLRNRSFIATAIADESNTSCHVFLALCLIIWLDCESVAQIPVHPCRTDSTMIPFLEGFYGASDHPLVHYSRFHGQAYESSVWVLNDTTMKAPLKKCIPRATWRATKLLTMKRKWRHTGSYPASPHRRSM